MNEQNESGHPAHDSCDYDEERFYEVMAEGLAGDKIRDVSLDLFDSADGNQHRIDSQGNAVVLVVAKPETAEQIKRAAEHWEDHACQASINVAMFLLFFMGAHYTELF